jgi:hypothetical protein
VVSKGLLAAADGLLHFLPLSPSAGIPVVVVVLRSQ